jgi:hypothetical protein
MVYPEYGVFTANKKPSNQEGFQKYLKLKIRIQ